MIADIRISQIVVSLINGNFIFEGILDFLKYIYLFSNVVDIENFINVSNIKKIPTTEPVEDNYFLIYLCVLYLIFSL